MAKNQQPTKSVKQYEHSEAQRPNNPQIGLVDDRTDTDHGQRKKQYAYDPHVNPELSWDAQKTRDQIGETLKFLQKAVADHAEKMDILQERYGDAAKDLLAELKAQHQEMLAMLKDAIAANEPQLNWTGKKERTSFEVPTVSLHVHERIDPKTILKQVKSEKADINGTLSLFEQQEKPYREAIEFYKHQEGWTNRLIAGDSLVVMNSLLEKEGMAGKVQMVYFDPPYGIKYGSNFQPFVNKRDVKDGKDEDLTQEPEMIKAFRDTWELGIHSYLTYLRDRLLLARELLHESGSIFVQISDENVHHVREIMDEVFGSNSFSSIISFSKSAGGLQASNRVGVTLDYVVWYVKDSSKPKYRALFEQKSDPVSSGYTKIELNDGERRNMTKEEKEGSKTLPDGSKPYMTVLMTKPGPGRKFEIEFNGKKFDSGNMWWGTTEEGLRRVIDANRVEETKSSIRFINYFDDFPFRSLTNLWSGLGGAASPIYVVQTSPEVIKRCLLMTTDPGDLVLDITCGSGTTAAVAEQWGRRWITCDTSRVALNLAKQRLMTAQFDYYQLAFPTEGIRGGFKYKTVPHITLKSIANDEPPGEETLYDQPLKDTSKTRVTGPFTVESVPSTLVKSVEEAVAGEAAFDPSAAQMGETQRQAEWRDQLRRTGVRGKAGETIAFTHLEALPGTKYLQAKGEAQVADSAKTVLVCFGPEHASMDARLIERAIEEAKYFKPDILLFCAFRYDNEAIKDIESIPESALGFQLLRAEMDMDLQTEDLKKKVKNQSFWLIGQPDVAHFPAEKAGEIKVEVKGFDYYNPKNGRVESGGKSKIAMWMLDTDYNGRSLYPRQVFFPMSGEKDGWQKLGKSLKAELDEEKLDAFRGTVSLPFVPGKSIAVKIIDDRGVESMKIIAL